MKEFVNSEISCTECESAIVAGSYNEDPGCVEHIKHCRNCSDFLRFQQDLLQTEPVLRRKSPELAVIRQEALRRKKHHRNLLHFTVIPAAAAAMAAVAAGGFYWQMEPLAELELSPVQATYRVFDDDLFKTTLETSSVTLAWDQSSSSEDEYRKSVRAAAEMPEWNIEIFNPYIEE
jgi:hypothetical protein